MRIFWISLLLLLQTPSYEQGTWETISVPSTSTFNSVFFADSLYGWIAGDSGTIIHTTDGGTTWDHQVTGTTNNIVSLFFLDRERGWASSQNFTTMPYGTLLLKTMNGGAEWSSVPYPDNDIFINCILFLDSLNGWMGGNPHALVRTTDGGITWSQPAIDTSVLAFFPVLNIRFYNEKYGYACGGRFDIAGVIWRTDNGGEKWYAIDPLFAPADEVHELHLFDSLHVMGAGGDPDFGYGVGMMRTSDGGISWNYQELSIQGYASDLDFRNEKEAWAPLGSREKLIYSLDTGKTWTEIPSPGSAIITKLTFPDSLHGFGIGRNGAVIKYKQQLSGISDPDLSEGTFRVILGQNYPNPFSSFTRINLKIPDRRESLPIQLQVRVFSMTGSEVANLAFDSFLPGQQEVIFDGRNLPPGIYYYRLYLPDSGRPVSGAAPKKMVIIR